MSLSCTGLISQPHLSCLPFIFHRFVFDTLWVLICHRSLMIFNGPHLSWAHVQRFGALFMRPESLLKCHRFLLICHEGVMRDFSRGSFLLLQALNGIIGAAFGAAGQRCMAIRLKN